MAYIHVTTPVGNSIRKTFWKGGAAADSVELDRTTNTPTPLAEPYANFDHQAPKDEQEWLSQQGLVPASGDALFIRTDDPDAIRAYSTDTVHVVAYNFDEQSAQPITVQNPSKLPDLWPEASYYRDLERLEQMATALSNQE